jgi:hypothetical protein
MERSACLKTRKELVTIVTIARPKSCGISNRARIVVDVRLDANLADCAHIVTDPLEVVWSIRFLKR